VEQRRWGRLQAEQWLQYQQEQIFSHSLLPLWRRQLWPWITNRKNRQVFKKKENRAKLGGRGKELRPAYVRVSIKGSSKTPPEIRTSGAKEGQESLRWTAGLRGLCFFITLSWLLKDEICNATTNQGFLCTGNDFREDVAFMFLSSYLLESPGEVVESLSLEVSKKRASVAPGDVA